jgi:lauroyl/myristoyl acyltransferase
MAGNLALGILLVNWDLIIIILVDKPISMGSESKTTSYRSEVIRSPTIYTQEFIAQEEVGGRNHRSFGGTRIKSIIVPKVHWLLLHTPIVIAIAPVRLAVLLLRALYWWPQNPLRLSCEHICNIARRAGHQHQGRQVYQQLLTNLLGAVENYFDLYDRGLDFALDRVQLSTSDDEKIRELVRDHGGVLLMVPHNFGTSFSILEMNRTLPLLVVVRNSPTIERTKITVDYFTRMQVSIVLVRGGNPFQLSRTLFSVLKAGKIVTATVDKLDNSKNRVEVDMFGSQVGLSPWAARIAARMNVPVVPTYCRSRGRQMSIVLGSPLISENTTELIQHYARFFEQNIIEDPASWAFLGDKHWAKALRKANSRIDKTTG